MALKSWVEALQHEETLSCDLMLRVRLIPLKKIDVVSDFC
jgi:hypothetical protein